MIPVRQILTKEDLERYQKSEAYSELITFLEQLNSSVIDVKTRDTIEDSSVIKKLLHLLEEIHTLNTEIKPTETNSRFGNPAFRDFHDAIQKRIPELLLDIVPEDNCEEVSKYIIESFGNRRRIDYGTGHELNFLTFMLCLDKLNIIEKSDYKALVIHVFFKYIEVMRGLQLTYWLEPAGSHGVWGLDDYHFLPFLFGAAQLRNHKHLRPKSIHNAEIVEEFSKDYIYLECVRFVDSIKTGSLRWHSPMLDDISGAKSWEKVNVGLVKMFQAEVVGKLPIMQHYMFGSIISFEGGSIPDSVAHEAEENEHSCDDHSHVYAFGQEFPDCCGIKIPSAIAAAAAASSSSAADVTSSVPFKIGANGVKLPTDSLTTMGTQPPRSMPRPIPFD